MKKVCLRAHRDLFHKDKTKNRETTKRKRDQVIHNISVLQRIEKGLEGGGTEEAEERSNSAIFLLVFTQLSIAMNAGNFPTPSLLVSVKKKLLCKAAFHLSVPSTGCSLQIDTGVVP